MTLQLKEIEAAVFLDFAKRQANFNYLQTPEMKAFREERGAKGYYLGLFENDSLTLASLVFLLPIRFGQKLEITGGPVGLDTRPEVLTAFFTQLKDFARKQQVIYAEIEPNWTYQILDDSGQPTSTPDTVLLSNLTAAGLHHLGFYKDYPYGTPRYWYVKDLSNLTEADLVSSYAKEAQYSYKKAGKFGIQVRRLAYDELAQFKELTEAAAEYHDFEDKNLAYYQQFYRNFGEKADFLVAEIDFDAYKKELQSEIDSLQSEIDALQSEIDKTDSAKKKKQRAKLAQQQEAHQKRLEEASDFSGTALLSGGLFIYNPRETVYLFSGTLDNYRKFYSPYLIQTEIMRRSLARGITRYNFLGISGHFDGTDGVLRFKTGFRGYVEEKIGRFTLTINPAKYAFTRFLKTLLRRG
ncbi:MAG: aminoacyltransferase [Streptococcaceae bacterium]|jgi:alanine adding enzyme|nr:aminoacyltransferase [Streptococcaceae bacterium]